ncbi:3-phosphoshikimate 1-carboxyvinyltransferase [Bacillus horti]|uniref:3-phosphoshikimate 1-carboxyvinyltransferase n=1 Tax=Caldalkalibacillus horti TaxID=77523 RepID=A0ABT9VXE1_9BACI|nr:3-phosphoshikimate 1-carboxyvinyltransferase [Bacillus horti]MDQ0165482.1 3-phosphoshikimate 1-carboxyvinyltransferase [Bacillus horti]
MKESRSSRSPWAFSAEIHEAFVSPVKAPVHGAINVPGSKSYTNRALIIAALAEGTSTLRGILRSDDSYWCLDALKRLGTKISINDEEVAIKGTGGRWPVKEAECFIGSAGTIARFLPGALAISQGGSWVVDGSQQLRDRPLSPLVDALHDLGAEIDYLSEQQGLPLQIKGTGLRGGEIEVPGNVSSQFLSGLLIASPLAEGTVKIRVVNGLVQPSYIGITVQLMRQFGAQIEHNEDYSEFHIEPGAYRAQDMTLEADASTACYFLALAALTQGEMVVKNVGYHSFQPDAQFIDVLELMGCAVEKTESFLKVIGPEKLKGGFTVDMKPMSDQALTIGALAPFANAPITVSNVAHIRKHESDRITVICQALQKLGIQVEEREDGFTIYPGEMQGAQLDPHDDHRNAMVFGLISTKVDGISILDPGCVSKTCPTFFDELKQLGVDVSFK